MAVKGRPRRVELSGDYTVTDNGNSKSVNFVKALESEDGFPTDVGSEVTVEKVYDESGDFDHVRIY